MRKVGYYLVIILLAFFLTKCCDACPEEETPICEKESPEAVGPNITLIPNELVVRIDVPEKLKLEGRDTVNGYISSLTEKIKLNLNNQLQTGPESIEYCPCDPSQQLWKFPSNQDLLEIEDLVTGTEDGSGRKQVEGDLQFMITLPKEGDGIAVNPEESGNILKEYRVPGRTSDAVNIAILDTGLDMTYFDETSQEDRVVLYLNPDNLELGRECKEKGAWGWNFVDNNSNVSDNHESIGHGTLVTKTIITELKRAGTPYRILPIKVFDNKGQGKYSTILCGMSFLNKVQALNRDLKIVNASFGGNLGNIPPERTKILQDYIDGMQHNAIVVASAGNCHFDTDDGFNNHYPSGYISNNIVSVAGYKQENNTILLSDSSNYGQVSIDVAARFERKLKLTNNNGTLTVQLRGTSYSAALVSARFAELIKSNPTWSPKLLKQEFLSIFPSNNNIWTEKSAELIPFVSRGRYVRESENTPPN